MRDTIVQRQEKEAWAALSALKKSDLPTSAVEEIIAATRRWVEAEEARRRQFLADTGNEVAILTYNQRMVDLTELPHNVSIIVDDGTLVDFHRGMFHVNFYAKNPPTDMKHWTSYWKDPNGREWGRHAGCGGYSFSGRLGDWAYHRPDESND